MTAQVQSMSIIKLDEGRAAAVVNAGDPWSEIAMIGIQPVTLRALRWHMRTLTEPYATADQKRSAAQVLIRSTHRPHRIAAAPYLMETAQ